MRTNIAEMTMRMAAIANVAVDLNRALHKKTSNVSVLTRRMATRTDIMNAMATAMVAMKSR
jgi:hypothetical protein